MASVIGEDELSPTDKDYIKFGHAFEEQFIAQDFNKNRSIDETLDLGWALLRLLPISELDRVDQKYIDRFIIRNA